MSSRISKDLAFFLKKKKLYTSFLRYTRQKNSTLITLTSFDWHHTEEGYLFWREVSDEYTHRLSMQLRDYWAERYGWRNKIVNTYGNY
jgi:hypothetical protein